MPKVRFKGPIGGLSGSMDGMVFADNGKRTVAYIKKPRTSEKSEAELRRDYRMAEARSYAKNVKTENPELWALYKQVAKPRKISPQAIAIADFMNVPQFSPLDLINYQGRVGELDIGSFITDFAAPILEQIGYIIEPLEWLIGPTGLLNKRLPVISDLAGSTVTIRSLAEALLVCGFTLERVDPRFLPATTRSRLPRWPWLVEAWLALRPLSSLFTGRQFLVVARRPGEPGRGP